MLSLKISGTKKISCLTILTSKLSKTSRKQEEDMALSKNHGANIKYLKRLVEDHEAKEELERELQRKADDQCESNVNVKPWVLN